MSAARSPDARIARHPGAADAAIKYRRVTITTLLYVYINIRTPVRGARSTPARAVVGPLIGEKATPAAGRPRPPAARAAAKADARPAFPSRPSTVTGGGLVARPRRNILYGRPPAEPSTSRAYTRPGQRPNPLKPSRRRESSDSDLRPGRPANGPAARVALRDIRPGRPLRPGLPSAGPAPEPRAYGYRINESGLSAAPYL